MGEDKCNIFNNFYGKTFGYVVNNFTLSLSLSLSLSLIVNVL